MKAIDEYFLMVVFTLLLNRLHIFAIMFNLFGQRNMAVKRLMITLACDLLYHFDCPALSCFVLLFHVLAVGTVLHGILWQSSVCNLCSVNPLSSLSFLHIHLSK